MNERKLKAKCVECDVTAEGLASAIGMSVSTYYRKVTHKSFTVTDIINIAHHLHLSANDVVNIFFEGLVA